MKRLYKNRKKAFGLVEVLFSGVIIAIITGMLVFAERSALASSEYVQERAAALYLGQQGIEIIRQMRDSNWIDGRSDTDWKSFEYTAATNTYSTMSVDTNAYHECKVNTTAANRYYLGCSHTVATDGSTTNSIAINGKTYTRKIIIEKIGGNLLPDINGSSDASVNFANAIKVTVNVEWVISRDSSGNDVKKTASTSEVITNWRPSF